METDWQTNLTKLKDRGQYLLQTEKLADCRFVVGTSPNQRLISGHRLLLAMASPVFEVMFFGSLPEKDNPIVIPDVQPFAFKTMIHYIYTDEISIASFDHACELYYVAKKYMLPHVDEYCTNFLLANLSPKNACRAYEFGILYDQPRLIKSSMELIVGRTLEVISDPSFMDIEASTLMAILDQSQLNINSELDLFNCVLELANQHGILNDEDRDNKTDAGSDNTSDVVVKKIKLDPVESSSGAASEICDSVPNVDEEVVAIDSNVSVSGNASDIIKDLSNTESEANLINLINAQSTIMDVATLRQAVKKIRFLTMTPQQFAEGPARSKLLLQSEVFAILIKISSPTINNCPMPDGFCQLGKRDGGDKNRYCISASKKFNTEYYNSNVTDAGLSFKVDTDIYLWGIRIKFRLSSGQIINSGDFSACLQNLEGSQIASTDSIENVTDSQLDIIFNSPVYIHHSQIYLIQVTLNKVCHYTMSTWDDDMVCNVVKFSFYTANLDETDRSGLINSIIFST